MFQENPARLSSVIIVGACGPCWQALTEVGVPPGVPWKLKTRRFRFKKPVRERDTLDLRDGRATLRSGVRE